MAGGYCHHCASQVSAHQRRYRWILWIALVINLTMFVVEIFSGLRGGSVSLMADSLDFLGDAANYGISLLVLGLSLTLRARASRIKAVSMGVFGLWVIGLAILNLTSEVVPSAPTMGIVGLSALIANCVVALLLFTYRDGDSNMHSVWICTRNDVLGNIAVLVAALGVFGTRTGWPDLAVAIVMSILALTSAFRIFRQANAELRAGADVRSVASKALAALSQRRHLGRYAYSLHGSKSEKTRTAGCYAEGSAETLAPENVLFDRRRDGEQDHAAEVVRSECKRNI